MAGKITPMMKQYLEFKELHPDALLFFRVGDFYEMFFEDAEVSARELNITLTSRDKGTPMCGVPHHAVESYVGKLIKKGYRVAICDQVEDPKEAKGIVKRDIIRIVTPGTVLSEEVLCDAGNRYLACLVTDGEEFALTAADVSTGECLWYAAKGADAFSLIKEQLYRLQPREIILKKGGAENSAESGVDGGSGKSGNDSEQLFSDLKKMLKNVLPSCLLNLRTVEDAADRELPEKHFGKLDLSENVKEALTLLLTYLHETVMADLSQINTLEKIRMEQFMQLDSTAIRNLELVKNMRDGGKKGTLLEVLDFTATSMGARALSTAIVSPLLSQLAIRQRQDAIEELVGNPVLRSNIMEQLKRVYDLERILSRLEVGSANARDLVSLKLSLAELPGVKKQLTGAHAALLRKLYEDIQLHGKILELLQASIVDEPPFSLREGGMIKRGFNEELDELHDIAGNNSAWLQNFESSIKEKTGIKTLKVGFNKVFGYYIEVSKGQASAVPPEFVRKQTLVNAERYIVPELKTFENKVLSAKEKIENLEYYLFQQIRESIRCCIPAIQNTAKALAQLDVLCSLALAAFKYDYHRPALNDAGKIDIQDGRHPVVERLLEKEIFVPNNTELDSDEDRLLIITGPNMAGKSTYMRQVALLVLMTQIGSFIPAESADICTVNRIFTRVGASDDLATGQSTFMVEMNEVARILKYADKDSLIILDEVGRGTSTYDGMSIARAVIEYIQKRIGAKTLFATHYHELIALEEIVPGIKNYSVAIKERGSDVVFLRRIVRGGTDKSYGVHVAKLAGLPKEVLKRAEEVLREFAGGAEAAAQGGAAQGGAAVNGAGGKADGSSSATGNKNAAQGNMQVAEAAYGQENAMGSLFMDSLRQDLLDLDVMSLTPIEAMNVLFELQQKAKM